MTLDARLIAYLPNGASQGPLPTPDGWDAGMPLNDAAALTLAYSPEGARAALLGQPLEIGLEVSYNGGAYSEVPNGRFLYLRDGRDPIKTGDQWQVDAPGYIWRLTKARNIPGSGVWNDEGRVFDGVTVGAILHDLFTAAQARGAMAGMAWDFSATVDSAGAAWGSTISRTYPAGTDYLSILQDLANQGLVDYRTQGRTVQVYKAGTMATDRTVIASPVVIRPGRDMLEAPFRRTWEGVADYAYVAGDNGSYVERTNAGAVTPWGRWETYLAQGGIEDTGTLTALGDLNLATMADARLEHTTGLDFSRAGFVPFVHYQVGDQVLRQVDTEVPPETVRVFQITLTRDGENPVQGNVVLNDRFTEGDVRTARQIAALTGSASGGTGAQPSPVGPDILQPAQVSGWSLSSLGYHDANGWPRSQITADWNDVTTNADGSAMTDLDHYEVWRKPTSGTVWERLTDTTASVHTSSPYEPGSSWDFRIRAVDTSDNEGAFSSTLTQVGASPTSAPATSSTPVLTVRLGVLQVDWDGLTSGGVAYGTELAHVEVHVSTTNGFTPSSATLWDVIPRGGGLALIDGLPYSTVHYVKLVPRSKANVAGTASTQASATITPLVSSDLIGTPVQSQHIGSLVADKITAGTISAVITLSGEFRTAASGNRVVMNSTGIKAYDPSGVLTFDLSSSTGLATLTGGIRTNVTGQRIEIVAPPAYPELQFYTGDVAEISPGFITVNAGGVHAARAPYISMRAPWFAGSDSLGINIFGRSADGTIRPSVNVFAGSAGAVVLQGLEVLVSNHTAQPATRVHRRVASAERTTNSANFTTTEVVVDTLASVPVTAGAVYRVRWSGIAASTVASDVIVARVRVTNSAGAVIGQGNLALVRANSGETLTFESGDWTAPTTGLQTFVITMDRNTGTGTCSSPANAGGAAAKAWVDEVA